ncbi:MAG: secretin and TonB N-terminal domain-containing protein [Polaromonas sp.]|nr:secretin and TonB N-terminal domain-containing protein [Polaromonas sp.]
MHNDNQSGFWRVSATSLAVALMAAGCSMPRMDIAAPSQEAPASAYSTINAKLAEDARAREAKEFRLPPEARGMVVTNDRHMEEAPPRLYSFRARQLHIRDALGIFARANGLNLISDPDLTGTVTVDFTDVPLTSAFEVLLTSLGYSWEQQGGVIRVRSTVTKAFELDYIRAARSGRASASATAVASEAGGGSGGTRASSSLSDSVTFWQEIDQQIKSLLSPRGSVLINRLTGTIIVTDSAPKIEEVEQFIALIKDGMHRQVDIEVRIVEVTLNEDYALGLDWSRLQIGGMGTALAASTIISGGTTAPSTFSATYSRNNYSAVINALKQQGDVRMVSQPRIRIMNNQTAFVKVGTSDTFYTRTNFRTTTAGIGISDTISEQPTTVDLGVMMTVTPQISSDGWTMLHVAPTVTRLAGTKVSPSGQSTAPVLEIKEASTLVRARSGELVVLGGLIEEEGSQTTRAIPGIGEGTGSFNPFRAEYQASRRKELVIFLMPTVIPNN